MNNPFLIYNREINSQYVSPLCSINSVILKKLPVKGIEDEIEGKRAMDIFCTQLIVDEIKSQAKKLKIDISSYDDSVLPKFLDEGLLSSDIKERRMSRDIATRFGNRLGLVLLTLKTALPENRQARKDWTDAHWRYWQEIKSIILVGGLASGILGRRFKECIHYIFDKAGVKPYNIILFESGSHIGTMGCATLICKENIKHQSSKNIVLDFGQTNIKRSVVTINNGEISEIKYLDTFPSIHMETNIKDSQIIKEKAFELNKYLIGIIEDTYKNADIAGDLGEDIIISIANYTVCGKLNNYRGGYAKLSVLGSNYSKILSDELSGRLHKNVCVKLVHDGTATAIYFRDYQNAVCLTLGTAFGVGFTEIKL